MHLIELYSYILCKDEKEVANYVELRILLLLLVRRTAAREMGVANFAHKLNVAMSSNISFTKLHKKSVDNREKSKGRALKYKHNLQETIEF